MPIITSTIAPTVAPQSSAVGHNDLQMVALIVGIVIVALAVLATCYLATRMARRRQEVSKNATVADIEAHKAADVDEEITLETKLEIIVIPTLGSDGASRDSDSKPATDLLVCRPERFVGVIHVLEAIEAHELFIEAWGSDDEEDSNSDEKSVADTEVSPTGDDDELPSERPALPPVPTVASSPSTPTIEENTAVTPSITPTPEPEPLISAFLATVYDDGNASKEDPLDDLDASANEPNLRIHYLDLERIPEIKVIPPSQPHQAIIEQTPSSSSSPPPPPPPPPPQSSPKSNSSHISPPPPLPRIPSAPPKPPARRSPFGLRQPPTPKATPGARSSYSGRNRAPKLLRPLYEDLSSSSIPATSGTSTLTSSTLRQSAATKPNALPTPSRTPPLPRSPSSSGSSATPSLRRTPALRTTKAIVRTPSSTILPSSITPTTSRVAKLSSATPRKATRTVTSYPTPPPTAPRTSKHTLSASRSSSAGAKRTTPGWR